MIVGMEVGGGVGIAGERADGGGDGGGGLRRGEDVGFRGGEVIMVGKVEEIVDAEGVGGGKSVEVRRRSTTSKRSSS